MGILILFVFATVFSLTSCDKISDFLITNNIIKDKNAIPDSSDISPPNNETDNNDLLKDWPLTSSDILVMMTRCSNNDEFTSGCERYLAGESAYDQTIDELVAKRNQNAYESTNLKVSYKYYDDNAELYGFSRMYSKIEAEVMSADSTTPDMYCNWMTDLLVCSLKGCFANLYSKQYGTGEYKGKNYLNFNDDSYMADLMGSLTLSTRKIYVVASDYFIDLIRAFCVIPVNVSLFNEISSKMYPNVPDPTINTFLNEVKPCDCLNECEHTKCTEECASTGWTYDRLMQFSQAIYKSVGTSGTENINDRLGFALGNNGLPAAGLIYTSSVTIINKEWNNEEKKYDYSYPTKNTALENLIAKISDMIEVNGIMYVTASDASSLNFEGTKTPLLGIRNQFTTDKLLFGGIVLVGSLDHRAYQDMKTADRGGFGVVPVPVYQYGDRFNPYVHSLGRAGAIRANTSEFVQCSAFIQYQSTHSKEILNSYYDLTLGCDDTKNEYLTSSNIAIVKYMRQNIHSTLDKLYEDAISFMYAGVDENSVNNRFHNLLCTNGYQLTDIASKYAKLQPQKASALKNLEDEYANLPA